MNKKIIFITALFFAFIIFFFTRNKFLLDKNISDYSEKKFTRFEKKNDRNIASEIPKQEELAKVHLEGFDDHHQNQKREEMKEKYELREGRFLIGDDVKRYANPLHPLPYRNTPDQKWKAAMAKRFLTLHDEGTKLFIKEEFPFIKIVDNDNEPYGLYVEQAVVTIISKNNTTTSFRALVDSQNGEIYQTWDQTIHENLKSAWSR